VPPGAYAITLKFAEISSEQTGQRLFHVSINDQQVLTNFDVYAAAGGPNLPIDRVFRINVPSGSIQILLTPILSSAIVSGIEIFRTGPIEAGPDLTKEHIRSGGRVVASLHRPVQKLLDVVPGLPHFEVPHQLLSRAITNGCKAQDPPPYCPNELVTRGQMAAFVARAIAAAQNNDQGAFTCWNPVSPSQQIPCSQVPPYFTDVPQVDPFFTFVQKIRQLGITAGCTATTYCPSDNISNGQLAVFVARARQVVRANCANTTNPEQNKTNCDASIPLPADMENPNPPDYPDVPPAYPFYTWIRFLRGEGVIKNEQVSTCIVPGNFCPEPAALEPPNGVNGLVSRLHMAYFLARGILGDMSF